MAGEEEEGEGDPYDPCDPCGGVWDTLDGEEGEEEEEGAAAGEFVGYPMLRGRDDGADGDEMSVEMRAACGVKNDGGDDIRILPQKNRREA